MAVTRRRLLVAAGAAAALSGCDLTLEHGLLNPCRQPLPAHLAQHNAVLEAWEGIDPQRVWDCHAHLVGEGDSGSGIWINPDMRRVIYPLLYAQRLMFRSSGCADAPPGSVDERYVERLRAVAEALRPGAKVMLLALDWHHDEHGEAIAAATAVHIPNDYVRATARRYRHCFEWVASIHPYRHDCFAALQTAKTHGARAVKWLPAVMGIDPSSARCDPFYAALKKLDLPLITHAGMERALRFRAQQSLGNPLLLRRPLEHGVRVVVAHCATLGEDRDLDRGPDGPYVPSFQLFARLMDHPRYGATLYGDISAVAQINRARLLPSLLERREWHARLLNGSDYPLPGVMPIYSMSQLAQLGVIEPALAEVLAEIREYNPLLFDFVLKRQLRFGQMRFAKSVFETRPHFQAEASG